MQATKEVVLKLDFGDPQPENDFLECSSGIPMVYGRFNHSYGHGFTRFVVNNVPGWVCPAVCPRRDLNHCSGQQFVEDPIAQQLIKADTYRVDTYGLKPQNRHQLK